MRSIYILFSLLLSISNPSLGQTSWMLAETIDRSDVWNRPFYSVYNSADKLISNQTDSSVYCTDCNLATLIWKGIESNKIAAYQTDKSSALVVQKSILLKKKLQTFLVSEPNRTLVAALHAADISMYRRAVSDKPENIKDLPIEWVSLTISIFDKSFVVFVKTKDCFPFLKPSVCYWVHPFNLNTKLNFADALIQRKYIATDYRLVAAYNLQQSAAFSIETNTLAQNLIRANKAADKSITSSSDTLLVYLKAMCSADIRSKENRGYYKVHLTEILFKLYADKKIKGYEYHAGGYFTPMTTKKLKEHLIVEAEEDGEYTVKRMDQNSLTRLHILKTEIKTASSVSLRNEWLLLGMGADVSTDFSNTYIIAFPFEEVLVELSMQKNYWYNGLNETDSLLLTEALHTQRIAYDEMNVMTVYGDTILTSTKHLAYNETKAENTLAALYYDQSSALIADFDAAHKRIIHPGKDKIESFELHYAFNALPNNASISAGIIEGIKSNKLQAYKDAGLQKRTTASDVTNMLDKTRFYKTGNAKKDSIYISKIPMAERYINSADLTEYVLITTYKTVNGKSTNTGIAFGIFIPAEIHPQYEQETLCYVSYAAMLKYLASVKTTKNYIKQLKALPNEKTIVEVLDFYGMIHYDALEPAAGVSNDLPAFVRERVAK